MPLLNFEDPSIGVIAPTAAEIRSVVAANWKAAFNDRDGAPELDTEDVTPAGQLIDSETAILSQLNAELLYLFSMLNPRISEGVWQDAIGYIYFIERKVAQPTVVAVTCTGAWKTVIPAGAQIESDNGERYECIEAATIPASGHINVNFRCVDAGPILCPAGTLNKIVTVIPGWDTVANASAGAPGRNRESQIDFESRRFNSVAKNSHGSRDSLQGALWDIEGVLDCKVLENTEDIQQTIEGVDIPGHSVAICIYGSQRKADVAKTIYMKKDAGCGTTGNTTVSYVASEYSGATYHYKILEPTTVNVAIEVTIDRTENMPSDAKVKIREAIIADFLGENAESGNTRVGLASTVYASRFTNAVVRTAGVQGLVGIRIKLGDGGWGSYIVISGDTEPVIEESGITVIVNGE